MRHQSRVIAFLVASPLEVLDLTGPLSVFTYPTVKGKPYYSFEILSTQSGDSVRSRSNISIGHSRRFSEYDGPIDTLVAIGAEGAIGQRSPAVAVALASWAFVESSPRCVSLYRRIHPRRCGLAGWKTDCHALALL
jgi:transcriptional regulator GlxA family with amidase domain